MFQKNIPTRKFETYVFSENMDELEEKEFS
jgi:hypothetical protein